MPLGFIKALPGETLKIEILHGVRVNDASAQPGDVVEVSVFDGRYLIGSGRAKMYVEPSVVVEPAPVVSESQADTAAIEIPAPDPKVAKKNSKKTETTK